MPSHHSLSVRSGTGISPELIGLKGTHQPETYDIAPDRRIGKSGAWHRALLHRALHPAPPFNGYHKIGLPEMTISLILLVPAFPIVPSLTLFVLDITQRILKLFLLSASFGNDFCGCAAKADVLVTT